MMLTYVWWPYPVSDFLLTLYFCLFDQTVIYWLNYLIRESWICNILVVMALWNAISIVQFSYVMNLPWIQHDRDVEKSGKRLATFLAVTFPTAAELMQVYLVSFTVPSCGLF